MYMRWIDIILEKKKKKKRTCILKTGYNIKIVISDFVQIFNIFCNSHNLSFKKADEVVFKSRLCIFLGYNQKIHNFCEVLSILEYFFKLVFKRG